MTPPAPPTSSPETFSLPSEMRQRIIEHARREDPRECCGIIGGVAGRATELHELTNLEPGFDRYLIDDAELFRVYRDLDERGAEIVAIYHSHPISPAYPSATDVALAFWPDAHYLICSLEHPHHPVIRAFRIVDAAIREVALTG